MATRPRADQFSLHMGAMCPKLSAQLRKQRLRFDAHTIKAYEKHLLHIITLSIHGLLTSQEKSKAFKRLVNKVQAHVQKYN